MKTQLKKIRKGFTLVEIMIVIAIIGLLAAIAIPGILNARRKATIGDAKNCLRVMNGYMKEGSFNQVYTNGQDVLTYLQGSGVLASEETLPDTTGFTLDYSACVTNGEVNATITAFSASPDNFTVSDTVTF